MGEDFKTLSSQERDIEFLLEKIKKTTCDEDIKYVIKTNNMLLRTLETFYLMLEMNKEEKV